MRISILFTTLFVAALSVLALPVAQRDSSNPSLSLRSDDVLPSGDIFYIRSLSEALKAAKAATAVVHNAAGLATQASKTKAQTQADRKGRKDAQKVTKAAKVEKAQTKQKSNPELYKSHEQKIKDKATVKFSPGASKRLDSMGLHGKDRASAKKFHKNIMKSEMKKNGAKQGTVVATAHKGGTVKDEKNHITAQFKDHKDRPIPSSWTDSKTGEVKTGEKDQHHVYVSDKKKVPSAWSNAVAESDKRKAAAKEEKKAESSTAHKEKVDEAKAAGEKKRGEIGADEKRAQREKVRAEKAARKKKPVEEPSTTG